MNNQSSNETQIYDEKTNLVNVGLRYTREQAKALAAGWSALGGVVVKIYYRRIKVDGVSFPVFMVVSRKKAK